MATPAKTQIATATAVSDAAGQPIPIYSADGNRVNISAPATGSSSAEATLPSGKRLVEIRVTDATWIRFGKTGMSAAAADANSVLWTAGSGPYVVPAASDGETCTHVRCMAFGASATTVQIEGVG